MEMCWKTEMTNVKVQVCCGTKYVIKRNVLKEQDMCWKTMTNVKVQVCYGTEIYVMKEM